MTKLYTYTYVDPPIEKFYAIDLCLTPDQYGEVAVYIDEHRPGAYVHGSIDSAHFDPSREPDPGHDIATAMLCWAFDAIIELLPHQHDVRFHENPWLQYRGAIGPAGTPAPGPMALLASRPEAG